MGFDAQADTEIRAACQGKAGRMILGIREAWEQHAASCLRPPKAILLHPANFELIGWEEALGLPVLSDLNVPTDYFRIHCGACGGQLGQSPVFWDEDGKAYLPVDENALAEALSDSSTGGEDLAERAAVSSAGSRSA